jgi:pimeloyl-ACP methyl ester carboxylesterase
VADGPYARARRIIGDYSRRGGAARWLHGVAFGLIEARGRFRLDDCDPAAVAGRVTCPVLLIHGQADNEVLPEQSQWIADRLGGPHERWLVPDAMHCQARAVAGAEYDRRIVAFFREHLSS